MRIALATTPQSNFKLIGRGFKLYAASFKQVFGLSLLLSLIVFMPRFIAIINPQDIFSSFNNLNFFNLFLILIEIIGLFVYVAMLWRIRCVITDEHESILDDFKIASQKILYIIGAAIVYTLILGLLFFATNYILNFIKEIQSSNDFFKWSFLLISTYYVINLYVFYLFIFYAPLILTENKGVFTALKKSACLVWGNWWRVFLLMLTPIVLYISLMIIVKSVFHINMNVYFLWPNESESIFAALLNMLIFAVALPYAGSVLLLQLRDLELRQQL